ncbi:hypothetical protein Salat_2644800 [Sesamum alatum]|uniref:Uncharacterized protein n=1 Tax=Sesamum alatum TaxID=300844 RepID=A0AAE1XP20_9LAMI|nr:hypothetical protein Salat_2644800 [Sesamum alatum]
MARAWRGEGLRRRGLGGVAARVTAWVEREGLRRIWFGWGGGGRVAEVRVGRGVGGDGLGLGEGKGLRRPGFGEGSDATSVGLEGRVAAAGLGLWEGSDRRSGSCWAAATEGRQRRRLPYMIYISEMMAMLVAEDLPVDFL